MEDKNEVVELAADIVAAYVGNNPVPAGDLPNLIKDVHGALVNAVEGAREPEVVELKPAVPIRRSITPDYLICLEDGDKSRKRKSELVAEAASSLTPAHGSARLSSSFRSPAAGKTEVR